MSSGEERGVQKGGGYYALSFLAISFLSLSLYPLFMEGNGDGEEVESLPLFLSSSSSSPLSRGGEESLPSMRR